MIGSGAERSKLVDYKDKNDLINVTMLDSVPKAEVRRYISVLDVALINLKKSDLFKTVIPSKIFENAGMQKPVLLGVQGEAQEIIEHYHAGLCFEPENEEDFMEKLDTLANDEQLYMECQEGCCALSKDFDRKKLANDMLDIITTI